MRKLLHRLRTLPTTAVLIVALLIATIVPAVPIITSSNTALAAGCAYPTASKSPAGTTTIASNPTSFTTLADGDVLASTLIVTGSNRYVAIGGNFSGVVTPDGVTHPAANLAVLNETTGAVVYAASSANSYVRALAYDNNVLYVGGDFTNLSGVNRSHIAAISTLNWALTSWNPGSTGIVRAIAASSVEPYAAVYYGGSSDKLYAVKPVTGAHIWTDPTSGGAIKALLLSPNKSALYVGGLFEQVSTFAHHGLMEISPAMTGKPYTGFKPKLATDNPAGGYNGEENLSMAWDTSYVRPAHLIVGDGGHTINAVRSLGQYRGARIWGDQTEGDAQAVAVVGNTYVAGYHRNHGNYHHLGCPYPYFSAQFTKANGTILSYWDSKLTGNGSDADGGNNGVQSITVDPVTKKLFLFGAFKTHGASCPTWNTCSGGTPLQGIAMFTYQ